MARTSIRFRNLQVGTILEPDNGFTCMEAGAPRIVKSNCCGQLYVDCSEGHHYLSGQLSWNDGETVIGFTSG